MKYKITDMFPFNIRVEFEDGSWANVPITPEYTAEQIDDAVSKFDPDFLPGSDKFNKNISIGEERISNKLENQENLIATQNIVSNTIAENTARREPPTIDPIRSIFGRVNPLYAILLANYFSKKGDNRIEESLSKNLENIIETQNFTVEQVLNDLNYGPDDIFILAENELNNQTN